MATATDDGSRLFRAIIIATTILLFVGWVAYKLHNKAPTQQQEAQEEQSAPQGNCGTRMNYHDLWPEQYTLGTPHTWKYLHELPGEKEKCDIIRVQRPVGTALCIQVTGQGYGWIPYRSVIDDSGRPVGDLFFPYARVALNGKWSAVVWQDGLLDTADRRNDTFMWLKTSANMRVLATTGNTCPRN